MVKDATVAPKERVNILYKTEIGGAQEEVELPLNILVMGEYSPNVPEDEKSLEDRKTISVDKDNFNDVLEKQNLGLTASVADKLSSEKDASLSVDLKFKNLNDFGPEAIVNQVPELKKLLGDEANRAKLMAELGIGNKDTK